MKTKKLRVLLMSPLPPPAGGIASWTEQILNHAVCKNDLQLNIINTSLTWRAVTDTSIWKRLIGGSIQAILNAATLWCSLIKLKPDVVHICTSGDLASFKDIVFLLLCRIRRVSTVIHFHFGRLSIFARDGGLFWLLSRLVIAFANVAIVLDSASEAILMAEFPDKMIIKLPNLIESSAYTHNHPTSVNVNITFVGHVVPSKGVMELVQVCSKLHDYKPILNLFGPFEEYFAKLLQKTASDSDVDIRIHGQVDREKARKALQDADIVVLPSHTEGFPMVILEAMSAGKPIVATCVGAIPEMLAECSENPCGLLINPRDVYGLENALRRLLKDKDLAAYLSVNAYRRVFEEYRAEVVFEKYMKVWKELSD